MKRSEFYPGWRMTRAQYGRYWRLVGEACAVQGATTSAAKEALRNAAHKNAFGWLKSAKDIDHKKDFTAIANELKRLANIVDSESNERRTLLYAAQRGILELLKATSKGYVERLLKDRFKVIHNVRPIDFLTDKQLTQLISTVNNRLTMLGGDRKTEVVINDNEPF